MYFALCLQLIYDQDTSPVLDCPNLAAVFVLVAACVMGTEPMPAVDWHLTADDIAAAVADLGVGQCAACDAVSHSH